MRKNVIIFAADMSSSVHFDNNRKDILNAISRNSLLEAGTKSEGEVTATGFEPTTT